MKSFLSTINEFTKDSDFIKLKKPQIFKQTNIFHAFSHAIVQKRL